MALVPRATVPFSLSALPHPPHGTRADTILGMRGDGCCKMMPPPSFCFPPPLFVSRKRAACGAYFFTPPV